MKDIRNIPKKIYLQLGDLPDLGEFEEPIDLTSLIKNGKVTFWLERIYPTDIEYDVHPAKTNVKAIAK